MQSLEAALTILMGLLCLLAYHKLMRLDINIHPISFLDDLLLFVCMPAFFLYGILILVPALFPAHGDTSTIADITVPIVLVRSDERFAVFRAGVCRQLVNGGLAVDNLLVLDFGPGVRGQIRGQLIAIFVFLQKV